MLCLAVVYQNFETSTAVQDSSTTSFTSIATTELELSTSADAKTTETTNSATVSTSVSTSSRHPTVGNHGYASTGTTATSTLSKHKATTASLRSTQTPKTTKCCCSCCSEDYATDAESCRSCARESLQTAVSCASKSAPPTTKVPTVKENFVAPKPVEGSRFPERLTHREEFRKQEQLTEVLAAMPAAEKAALGYSIDDLIVDCHYDGLPCDMDR